MKQNSVIYENVRVEMARKNITILEMANMIGIRRETLSRKLSGRSPILLKEALIIQRNCFPNISIQVLFRECVEREAI